jgi:hypothetical protein
LAKQLLQSVSAHLSGYAKIHAIARSWAIHVIHLIVKPLENAIVAPCQQRKQPNYTRTHKALNRGEGIHPRWVAQQPHNSHPYPD